MAKCLLRCGQLWEHYSPTKRIHGFVCDMHSVQVAHWCHSKIKVLRFGDAEATIRASGTRGRRRIVTKAKREKVIATQKVKFYVDAEGIVRGQVFGPRKWKQKRP